MTQHATAKVEPTGRVGGEWSLVSGQLECDGCVIVQPETPNPLYRAPPRPTGAERMWADGPDDGSQSSPYAGMERQRSLYRVERVCRLTAGSSLRLPWKSMRKTSGQRESRSQYWHTKAERVCGSCYLSFVRYLNPLIEIGVHERCRRCYYSDSGEADSAMDAGI